MLSCLYLSYLQAKTIRYVNSLEFKLITLFSNENLGEAWVPRSYCWLFSRGADSLWDSYYNGQNCGYPFSSSNISRVSIVLDISTVGKVSFYMKHLIDLFFLLVSSLA